LPFCWDLEMSRATTVLHVKPHTSHSKTNPKHHPPPPVIGRESPRRLNRSQAAGFAHLVRASHFCLHLLRLSFRPFLNLPIFFSAWASPFSSLLPPPPLHLSMCVLYFLLEDGEVPFLTFCAHHLHTQLPPPRDQKAIEVA
jgi:hypothetical protein